MSAGTLNGNRVTHADVWLPHTGVWHAVVSLDVGSSVPTTARGATLVLGGLELVGTVVSGGPWQGSARYRIVGGAGGWRLPIVARSYQSDVGVRRSLILGDAAREVGEQITISADGVVGTAFVRRAGPAGRVLTQLADVWWCDPSGVTQVGARAAGAVVSPFTVVRTEPDRGVALIATEKPEDVAPGRTVDVGLEAPWAIATVHHVLGGELRTEIWRAS